MVNENEPVEAVVKNTETSTDKFVVENPDLESNLETITVPKLEEKPEEFLKVIKQQKNNNGRRKKPVKSIVMGEKILTEISDEARELYNQSSFGSILDDGKVQLTLLEGLYLFEKGKLDLRSESGRKMSPESFLKKAIKKEPNYWVRYCVFKDMRDRGYIIKTALKFGADFRVYDRGIKPGEDHARWIVYPVHEGSTLTWYEFTARNRVAHSTKKRLLMGIVDGEGDVTYYEIKWMKP